MTSRREEQRHLRTKAKCGLVIHKMYTSCTQVVWCIDERKEWINV